MKQLSKLEKLKKDLSDLNSQQNFIQKQDYKTQKIAKNKIKKLKETIRYNHTPLVFHKGQWILGRFF